jgi:hypothetical protein
MILIIHKNIALYSFISNFKYYEMEMIFVYWVLAGFGYFYNEAKLPEEGS